MKKDLRPPRALEPSSWSAQPQTTPGGTPGSPAPCPCPPPREPRVPYLAIGLGSQGLGTRLMAFLRDSRRSLPVTRAPGPGLIDSGRDFPHPISKVLGAGHLASRRGRGLFPPRALGSGLPRGRGLTAVRQSGQAKSRAQARPALRTEPEASPREVPARRCHSAAQAKYCPPARPALGRRRSAALLGGARV